MKKELIITIVVLVIVLMNITVAMAGDTTTEKTTANLTYYKAGVLWDINGLTYDTNDKNIRDLHVDGQISYLKDLFGLENVNYQKKFSLGFLNLTMVFLTSREPLQ